MYTRATPTMGSMGNLLKTTQTTQSTQTTQTTQTNSLEISTPNFLSEWCSSGADMKKPWMDST